MTNFEKLKSEMITVRQIRDLAFEYEGLAVDNMLTETTLFYGLAEDVPAELLDIEVISWNTGCNSKIDPILCLNVEIEEEQNEQT